jgi:Carboxypeptidase regulatory-like domain
MRFPIQASRLFGFILGIFVFCLPLFSQTTTGRILGTVTDPSGAALPRATVTILDVQRGSTRTLSTDEAGVYLAPDLIPGTYKIRACFSCARG